MASNNAPAPLGIQGSSRKFTYIEAKQVDGYDGTGVVIPDLRRAPSRYYLEENWDLLPLTVIDIDTPLTGVVAVTTATTAVVGTGTLFLSELFVGAYLVLDADDSDTRQVVQVAAITSDTMLTLSENASDTHTAADIARRDLVGQNSNFVIEGLNGSNDDVTYAATIAGLQLQTDNTDETQVILAPNALRPVSAWNGVLWGTENRVTWELKIRTDATITTQLVWAGLKLTSTPTIIDDNDQVFFRYDTDVPDTEWQVIDSIADVDTTTSSGVTVVASTNYVFRIVIDIDRVARCYINGALVHTTDALTEDVDLIPFVGVETLDSTPSEATLNVGTMSISRECFE